MSILPLPPATGGTMSLVAATNSQPTRPAGGDMGTDNGGSRREQDEEFVSALQAASSSKATADATASDRNSPEGPRATRKSSPKGDEDTDRRAVLTGATWHTTLTGMPAPDAAGALALPAALLAHGQLALGTGAAGDIDADAPPVAVVGIGVVTEAAGEVSVGGVVTGPILNPAMLALSGPRAGGLAGLAAARTPGGVPGAEATAAPAPTIGAFGLPSLTVVPSAEERSAVEVAITANVDSAAAAAAFAGEDLTIGTDLTTLTAGEATAPGSVPGAVPGSGQPGIGVPGVGGPGAVPAGPGAAQGGPSVAATGPGGITIGAVAAPGATADATAVPPAVGAAPRQLSPAELAAVQETAAQNAAAQLAAARATADQLGQFLEPTGTEGITVPEGITGTVAAVPAGPPAPPGLPGYVPAVAGADAGTAGDGGTGRDTDERGEDAFTEALTAAASPTPEPTTFTPLAAPDVSTTPSIDLSGAAGPEAAPSPPPAAQVAEQIVPLRAQGDGVHRIAMELRPDDLGTIGVIAEIRNGQVHLHFTGANELTRETLRAALPDLRQQLEDAGFAGAAFDFGDGSGADQNDRRQFGAADQGTGNQPGRGGEPGNRGADTTTRPNGQRAPGYVAPPTPPGSGRHALDLQV